MTRACTSTLAAALVALFLAPVTTSGQEASVARDIHRMLSEAWAVTPTARALADELFRSASVPAAANELQPAYALTLIKQRRYPDALEETRSLLSISHDDLDLRWTELWLLLVNRKYEAALDRCQALAELVEAQSAAEDVPVPLDAIESLGAAIGFLEGPARESMTAAVMDQRIAKIFGRLDPTQVKALSRGRKNLLDDFTRRDKASRLADDQERQALQNERQVEQAQLEQERSRLVEEKAQLDQRQRALESEFRENSSRLRQREADATATALELADDAAFMRSRLILLDADLARLDVQIVGTNDPAIRAVLIAEYNNVVRIHRRQLQELRNVQVQLATANQNLAIARDERARYQQQSESSQAAIDSSQHALNKTLLRVNRRQSELAWPPKKASARARAQRRKTVTWITYMPYPLEAQRLRLLETATR